MMKLGPLTRFILFKLFYFTFFDIFLPPRHRNTWSSLKYVSLLSPYQAICYALGIPRKRYVLPSRNSQSGRGSKQVHQKLQSSVISTREEICIYTHKSIWLWKHRNRHLTYFPMQSKLY